MADMPVSREAITFPCHGDTLVGVVTHPSADSETGLLVVVGGPQYRIGSHRQFVRLAGRLAAAGVPVLRFDHRGMGDSEGEPRPYDATAEDIRAAVDEFFRRCPAMRNVVLWGLCDGASAALLYARTDRRVAGLVLLNPWIDSERARARSLVTHYYRQRLSSGSFWKNLLWREIRLREVLGEIRAVLFPAFGGKSLPGAGPTSAADDGSRSQSMAEALQAFDGPVEFVLAGSDLTAATFKAEWQACSGWKLAMDRPGVVTHWVADADHSFSRPEWADAVTRRTLDTIARIGRHSSASRYERR